MSYNNRPVGTLSPIEGRAYDAREAEPAYRKLTTHHNVTSPTSLFDEYPPREVTDRLLSRYFETIGTVFRILSPKGFYESYEQLMQNPRKAKICFIVELLLVISLANSTLADNEVLIPQVKCLSWLDLATSLPATAMDLREFDIETVRMWALINLTRSVLIPDDLANYIHTGSAVRAGIIIGLHRKSTWHLGGGRRGLWVSLLELDIESCLSAGSMPSLLSIDALNYSLDEAIDTAESYADDYGPMGGTDSVDQSLNNMYPNEKIAFQS